MKNKIKFIFIFSCITLIPFTQVQASVRINEIAWQGYLGDANNEWIELYNEDSESVNLNGWVLKAVDETPSISLSGTIAGNSFFLLERTDDTTVPGIPADMFYTGALSNEGEHLILLNSSGVEQDNQDVSGGWNMESGSSNTFSFFNSGWAEGIPSPGETNQQAENTNDTSDTESNNEDDDSEGTVTSLNVNKNESKKLSYKEQKLIILASTHAFVGVPFTFTSHLRDFDGGSIVKGFYAWNMGDGSIFYKGRNNDFSHVYEYPGEYVVTLSYSRATFGMDPEEVPPEVYDEHVVQVLDKTISIESVVGGTVTLKNSSPHTMNIEDWVLTNNDVRFVIPKKTMVRAGKTITFSQSVTKLEHNPIFIINPTGQMIAYSNKSHLQENTESIKVYSQSQDTETETISKEYSMSEEETLSLENDFALEDENYTANVSSSNQKTLYVFFLVLLLTIIGGIVWLLLSKKKTNLIIEGYEIVEE